MPEVNRKGGHPVILPARLAGEIERIPPGYGLNWLLHRRAEEVVRHHWHDQRLLADIDTPEDYARYRPSNEQLEGGETTGSSPRGGE